MNRSVKNRQLKLNGRLDHNALSMVFDLYSQAIFKYALRLGMDVTTADQVVGDVFSQLIEQTTKGEGPKTNLRSYLYQIAYHRIVDLAREGKRTVCLDGIIGADNEVPLASQVEEHILLETLSSAINNQLTEEQRHVIILRFQEGLTLKETADIMEKKINAIKALQKRGIEKLQKIYDEEYEA